jgi:hypothetical protein
MTKPQQEELRRTGYGATDQDAKELRASESEAPENKGKVGEVPEENEPGHRPERDQDKPQGPPE